MGTWGTDVLQNDYSADVYDDFFDLYESNWEVGDITTKLIAENKERIENGQGNDFWFALALAQWECKALDKKVFDQVAEIIESGEDLELWKELDATEETILERAEALQKFLVQLKTEVPEAKSRIRSEPPEPIPEIIFKKPTSPKNWWKFW